LCVYNHLGETGLISSNSKEGLGCPDGISAFSAFIRANIKKDSLGAIIIETDEAMRKPKIIR
jgi:hypothetical protein